MFVGQHGDAQGFLADPLVIIQLTGGEIHGNKEVQLLFNACHVSELIFFAFGRKRNKNTQTSISSLVQKQFLPPVCTFSSSLTLPHISCFPPFTPVSTLTGERETASCQTVNISLSVRLFTVKKKEETAAKRHKLSSQNVHVVRRVCAALNVGVRLPACVLFLSGERVAGAVQLRYQCYG